MDKKIAVVIVVLVIIASASLYFSSVQPTRSAWGLVQSSTVYLIDTCRYDSPPVHCMTTPDNLVILRNGFSFSTGKTCSLQIGDPVNYKVSTGFNSQGVNDIQILNVPSVCQPL